MQVLGKPLIVVFCLPGASFGGRFLECWTELFAWCLKNGIKPVLSRKQSCNIYYVRNMCLGADVMRGKNQKPFDGKLDYDYLMWIDDGETIRVIPIARDPIRALRGSGRGEHLVERLLAARQAGRRHE